MRFTDKTAIVTGAADGIGKAIALKLSAEGANLVVDDERFMGAEDLSEKIKDMGGKALPVEADVSKMEDMERLFSEAVQAFGRVDIVVSNAGIRRDAPIHLMTETQWDEVISVQLKGCFNASRLAHRHMSEQGGGKIVIIAAPVPSGWGGPGQINFDAANAGLIGLTASLAIELGRYNINVNCVAPDFIETRMTRENIHQNDMYLDDFKKAALVRIPLRRLGTAEDVAEVAAFLASDQAGYVSGQVIKVRGGP